MFRSFKINLYNDWLNQIRGELNKDGYDTYNIDKEELPYKYFNLLNRRVSAVPRRVFISNELYKSYYYNKYKEVITDLKNLIEEGKDISPHLSKKIDNINYNDGLLNDWGIHHLHLSRKKGRGKFNERTGPLLYVRFEHNRAYFINIYNHKNWCKKEIIEIIHRNWEKDFERFRLKGVESIYPQLDEKDHQALRNSNINTLIQIDNNVVYMGFGLGMSSSGHSQLALLQEQRHRNALKAAENYINHKMIISGNYGKKIYFYPIFHDNYLKIIELYTLKIVYVLRL